MCSGQWCNFDINFVCVVTVSDVIVSGVFYDLTVFGLTVSYKFELG